MSPIVIFAHFSSKQKGVVSQIGALYLLVHILLMLCHVVKIFAHFSSKQKDVVSQIGALYLLVHILLMLCHDVKWCSRLHISLILNN
jgi:hypothetical protein